ncbi:MAG: YitT family protein [Paludibacteraceae bacterium]|jgi:uncharacterized membrane-anchored protein YitT (DUF2179 family)|nr:YitT family protein [Paludibacteraceae bacterium]
MPTIDNTIKDNNERRDLMRRQPSVIVREYLTIFAALCPFAMCVNWIFVPHNVVGAGLTGFCSIIYYATNGMFPHLFPEYGGAIPIWLTTLTINIILLTIASMTVGWQFCVRTLFGAVCVSFWYRVIPIRETAIIEDPIMGCIIGGLFFGVCLGVVMLNNGSSGGTDIVAMIVNKYRDISLGTSMVICDIVIILCSWFLPVPESMQGVVESVTDYRIRRIICGLCMAYCYTFSLDWLVRRRRHAVRFMIVSARYKEIADAISQKVNRGVTILNGEGWYSKNDVHAIYVLTRVNERQQLYRTVFSIDPDALVTETDATVVYGRGFDRWKGTNKILV